MSINFEKKFFDVLKNIFIGAKIEGQSGYVNLMRVKSKYYDEFLSELIKDFDKVKTEFGIEFKKELFNKLYTFFHKYFSESGSIYYTNTAYRDKVYERIYRDDKDVMLFWKTQHLYYVKTDRLFKSIDVEIEGYKFFFDASKIEHKQSNERRDLVFKLDKIKTVSGNKVVNFLVEYSQRGTRTKFDDIYKKLKKENGFKEITEEILERAFRVFNLQSEVDFFIHKDAGNFLKEQFSIWLKGYLLDDETEFNAKRIKQLKTLKEIAYKIIDIVAQFEDELVKIWNKPKFVLNSNYVITLNKIAERDVDLIKKIIEHPNFDEQVREWKELEIINGTFKKNDLKKVSLFGEEVDNQYKYLPIDTKFFKDLEIGILNLFENLDESLDGRLIHSENYQGLKSIFNKYLNKVILTYIDPPFNKDEGADYLYLVNYKDSNWISLLENRIRLNKELLTSEGTIYVKCDYNGNAYVKMLLDEIFENNFRSEIIWKRFTGTKSQFRHFGIVTDNIYVYSKSNKWIYNQKYKPYSEEYLKNFKYQDERGKYLLRNFYSPGQGEARMFFGKPIEPPINHHWRIGQKRIDKAISEDRIVLDESGFPKLKNYLHEMPGKPYDNLIDDIHVVQGISSEFTNFPTQNPEKLLQVLIESSSKESDVVLDYFCGSGTTISVAHKLKRKWIGMELDSHFYSIIIPRMKKVLSGRNAGITKELNWKGGGFFKYFDLEQYEEILGKSVYGDYKPLEAKEIVNQYIFFKDKKNGFVLDVNRKTKKIKVDLTKLYQNIDVAETLSNLKGKFIKTITKEYVEFEDGEKINLLEIDFRDIKPLIWW